MFKKLGKNPQEQEIQQAQLPFPDLADRPHNPFTTDIMNSIDPQPYEDAGEEEPETIIAEGVSISGTISFKKLIRIDGSFEGELASSGKIIIGPTGSVKANIDLEEAFISGKVKGNISVKKRLVLRGRAEVRGDITAPLISVDEGVSLLGMLTIAQPAESIVDAYDDDHYYSDN